MKNIIDFPAGGPSKVFLLASRFPSKASYKFLVVVLPEKLTQAETMSSEAVAKNPFVTTDLPTPVPPVINTLWPAPNKVERRYLYLTVSLVGTRISKKLASGLYLNPGT